MLKQCAKRACYNTLQKHDLLTPLPFEEKRFDCLISVAVTTYLSKRFSILFHLESISVKSLIMFAADLNFLLVLQKIALIPDFSSPRFLFFMYVRQLMSNENAPINTKKTEMKMLWLKKISSPSQKKIALR